jgi:hypothetical protein
MHDLWLKGKVEAGEGKVEVGSGGMKEREETIMSA